MKYIALLLVLLLASFPTRAQTLVPKETANAYFENCIKAPPTTMSERGQQMLCACTAARLTQFFTLEDMQAMSSNQTAIARPAFNRMLINVYAPCMEEPTREYHYKSCIENPQTAMLGKHPDGLCSCAANALATHMRFHGSEIFTQILAREPMITDPAAALFEDPEFQTLAQQKVMDCLKQ